MRELIKNSIAKLEEASKDNPIKVVSHFDTDGITAAAIFSRALQRWGKPFSLEIVKNLDKEFIESLPENRTIVFLDLASGSLENLKSKKNKIFIFDHHEIVQEIPDNVQMINPEKIQAPKISGAGIAYLFAKSLSEENKDLAHLAVIGMVGDKLEKDLSKTYEEILNDAETVIKKGLLLYPSTRPLDKALEYSSSPYIPEVTGSYSGAIELLREAKIERENGKYKALYELSEEEMQRLTTAVMLKCENEEFEKHIGNLYLIKLFNHLEDAREISALINACSRTGHSEVALGFCLGNKTCKMEAEKAYIEYKQNLVSGLKHVEKTSKIEGQHYLIINAKDKIKYTIIGTIASILSHSPTYKKGTIIVTLAYNEDKIKVSARRVGEEGRNVREILNKVVVPLGGEVGGHPAAAGCMISQERETQFIETLKKTLELEVVKV